MKIKVVFEFDEDQRGDIARYQENRFGEKCPKLATRAMCKALIDEAMDNQWLAVSDELHRSEQEHQEGQWSAEEL